MNITHQGMMVSPIPKFNIQNLEFKIISSRLRLPREIHKMRSAAYFTGVVHFFKFYIIP